MKAINFSESTTKNLCDQLNNYFKLLSKSPGFYGHVDSIHFTPDLHGAIMIMTGNKD